MNNGETDQRPLPRGSIAEPLACHHFQAEHSEVPGGGLG